MAVDGYRTANYNLLAKESKSPLPPFTKGGN